MKIIGQLIIGIVGMMMSILMAYGFSFFTEKVDYSYQKAIDNISYDRLKKVEDTARAMIATYKSDKLTYEAYKNTDVELATQAKIRANRTAVAYNDYILKNSFQWKGNIPSDIYNQLEIIEWGEMMEIYVRVIIIIFMFHFGVIGLVGIKYAMNDNKTKKDADRINFYIFLGFVVQIAGYFLWKSV